MKIHKQLKWLSPYLESVAHLVPLPKLTAINLRFYKHIPDSWAECNVYTDDTYSIMIRLRSVLKDKLPLPHWAQDEALCHLAHELSHMIHWEHTPERLLLEALIYHQFAVTVSRLGYEEKRNKVR